MKQFALRLPKELHKAIRDEAHKREISINTLIVVAIEQHLKGAKK